MVRLHVPRTRTSLSHQHGSQGRTRGDLPMRREKAGSSLSCRRSSGKRGERLKKFPVASPGPKQRTTLFLYLYSIQGGQSWRRCGARGPATTTTSHLDPKRQPFANNGGIQLHDAARAPIRTAQEHRAPMASNLGCPASRRVASPPVRSQQLSFPRQILMSNHGQAASVSLAASWRRPSNKSRQGAPSVSQRHFQPTLLLAPDNASEISDVGCGPCRRP